MSSNVRPRLLGRTRRPRSAAGWSSQEKSMSSAPGSLRSSSSISGFTMARPPSRACLYVS